MTSQIDATVPVAGNPTTESVRGNFATAANEISALQNHTTGAPFLPLSGAAMTGPMTLYNDPTGPMSPVTLGYFQAQGGGGGGGGGIPDAPADGTPYGRQDAGWHPVLPRSGGTLTGGLHFGSAQAASVTDLSRHIDLYGGTYGFNVGPSLNLNYNAPAGTAHSLLIAGAAVLSIATAAITSAAPIVLPSDPASAMQASTKQYTDAQVATKLADAPNDGSAYLRMSQGWRLGIPQLGAANTTTVAVVERTTGASRCPTITGMVTPSNANNDMVALQVRRLATPDGSGNLVDGASIQLYGPTFPNATYANAVQIACGSNAAGYQTWLFGANGQTYIPGLLQLAGQSIAIYLSGGGGTNSAQILSQRSGQNRWTVNLLSGADSGSNGGSDFSIGRFNDAGGYIDIPLSINRQNGVLNIFQGVTFPNFNPGHLFAFGWSPSTNPAFRLGLDGADAYALVLGHAAGGASVVALTMSANGAAVTAYSTGASVWWGATVNSDRRLKSAVVPCEFDALATLAALPMYSCDLKSPVNDELTHWHCSLMADEVEQVLPEAHQPPPVEGSYAGIHALPLLCAAIRAIQQLTARVATLEATAA